MFNAQRIIYNFRAEIQATESQSMWQLIASLTSRQEATRCCGQSGHTPLV